VKLLTSVPPSLHSPLLDGVGASQRGIIVTYECPACGPTALELQSSIDVANLSVSLIQLGFTVWGVAAWGNFLDDAEAKVNRLLREASRHGSLRPERGLTRPALDPR
jgi:hypothetical protein